VVVVIGSEIMTELEFERLAALLKELRGDVSQRAFSKQNGIHYAAWRGWEGKEAVPNYDNLFKIASLAGMNMNEFYAYLRTGERVPDTIDIAVLTSYLQGMPVEFRCELVKSIL
jgi:hypothetical protein